MSQNRSKTRLSLLNYIVVGFAVFGALCTFSKWSWLPSNVEQVPMSLGSFYFEAWLVFLCMAMVCVFALNGIRKIKVSARWIVVLSSISLGSCLVFIFRNSIEETANAAWFSGFSSLLCCVIGVIILMKKGRIEEANQSNIAATSSPLM